MSFRNVRENFMLTWPYSFPLQLPLICRRGSSPRKGLSFVLKMKMQAKVKNLKRIVFQGIFNFIVTQFELFWFSSLSYLIILSKFFVNETLWEVILNYQQNSRINGVVSSFVIDFNSLLTKMSSTIGQRGEMKRKGF